MRWNDAVREAGFQPNKKVSAIEETVLIENLIGLIRELGHFPVITEMRMKANRHPGFPSDKTFQKRFGSKQELMVKVQEYCNGRLGYEDVAPLCATTAITSAGSDGAERLQEETFGFVYLMRSGPYYKIGRSTAVGRREYELGILLPDPPSVIHKIRTDDPAGIEAYWHGRFASKRRRGEWFDLEQADVKAFRRRKFM